MTDLKNTILKKIKSGEIHQTSRWYFVTRDWLFYVLTAVTTVLGSLAVSSILFQTMREHAPRVQHLPRDFSYFKSFMDSMPWVWVVALLLLVTVAWFNYTNTRRAYRHHNALVLAVVLALSLAGGVVLFQTGAGQRFEEQVRKHVPIYRMDVERREHLRERFLEEGRARLGEQHVKWRTVR